MSLPISLSVDPGDGAAALHLQHSQPTPATLVISAYGHIDASNANHLYIYARRVIGHYNVLVLDLSELDFFGTEGLSVLRILNESLAHRVRIAVVPNREVARLLRLCPVGSTPVVTSDVSSALAAAQRHPRAALRLVDADKPSAE